MARKRYDGKDHTFVSQCGAPYEAPRTLTLRF